MTFLLTSVCPDKTMIEPESRQLEFEDVWLASQVEPLQDNFDVLGRVLLRMNMIKSVVLPGCYMTLKMDLKIQKKNQSKTDHKLLRKTGKKCRLVEFSLEWAKC